MGAYFSSPIIAAGSGVSSDKKVATAVAAAVSAAGVAKPTMAFCACTVAHKAADVAKEFGKLLPGVPIHGITSSAAILQPGGATPDGVGCLLIEAAEGSFATGFASDGSATAAATALKVKMATPKALILGATPGAEEGALLELAEIFPGVPVYGGTAADNDVSGKWSVFSESGASAKGLSLVGVGAGVKFFGSMMGPCAHPPPRRRAPRPRDRRLISAICSRQVHAHSQEGGRHRLRRTQGGQDRRRAGGRLGALAPPRARPRSRNARLLLHLDHGHHHRRLRPLRCTSGLATRSRPSTRRAA
jgi:hypothetical protein